LRRQRQWQWRQRRWQSVIGGLGRATVDAGNGSAGDGARLRGGLMMPTTRQRRSAAAWGGSDDGNGGAAADQAGRQATTGQLLPQQQPLPR